MQEVLVYGSQFIPEYLVQVLDYRGIALHYVLRLRRFLLEERPIIAGRGRKKSFLASVKTER
jgi:hypothetical protein